MQKSSLLVFSIVASLLITGCSSTQTNTPSDGTVKAPSTEIVQNDTNGEALNIVTTFPPLYAHAANLVDDYDTLTNLVPAGTSVHFWQPKPSDIVAMESADMIITNGLGLEEFLDDYLETLADAGVVIVDTSTGVQTLEFEASEHHDEDEHDDHGDEDHNDHKEDDDHEGEDHHEDEEGHNDDEAHDDHHHDHDGPDPHIWLDPTNAQIQVETITDGLIALDASQTDFYTTARDTYNDKLDTLDDEIATLRVDQDIVPFVVFHDAYQYFMRAYDLDNAQVGLVQEFHGDNPSQRQIAELIEIIQDQGVQTLYTEPQFNPSVAQRLASETGVTIREVDPIGQTLARDGYITMMQELAQSFIR